MGVPVSVVMSVYNGEQYLRPAIESVLNQTFRNFEFIIIDDASTDSTPRILREVAGSDDRIQIVANETNLGLTRSLNKGISLAKGEFIARQDADDLSLPDRLARQVAFLERHPAVGVVGTWAKKIDDRGQRVGIWQPPGSPAVINWLLLFGTALAHPTVLMRRSLFDRGAVYRPDIRYAQDYELWVRLSRQTQLANIPTVLYIRRKHAQMISVRRLAGQEQSVRNVVQCAVSGLLNADVSEALVASLRGSTRGDLLESKQDLEAVANLIDALYRVYLSRTSLTPAEATLVAEDVVQRLQRLAVRHASRYPGAAGRLLWAGFRLHRSIPTTRNYVRQMARYLMESQRQKGSMLS